MPQGTQKMVTGESAQKSGRPSVYFMDDRNFSAFFDPSERKKSHCYFKL